MRQRLPRRQHHDGRPMWCFGTGAKRAVAPPTVPNNTCQTAINMQKYSRRPRAHKWPVPDNGSKLDFTTLRAVDAVQTCPLLSMKALWGTRRGSRRHPRALATPASPSLQNCAPLARATPTTQGEGREAYGWGRGGGGGAVQGACAC